MLSSSYLGLKEEMERERKSYLFFISSHLAKPCPSFSTHLELLLLQKAFPDSAHFTDLTFLTVYSISMSVYTVHIMGSTHLDFRVKVCIFVPHMTHQRPIVFLPSCTYLLTPSIEPSCSSHEGTFTFHKGRNECFLHEGITKPDRQNCIFGKFHRI